MSSKSKFKGNEIEYKKDEWFYKDSGLKVVETHENTPCGNCGKLSTQEGHDACLGTLIGVMNACCGHGVESEAYVQFLDGECIHGEDAVIIIELLKKYSK